MYHNYNKPDYPCVNCTERKIGYHSTCKIYLGAKAKHNKKVAEIRQAKKKEDDIAGYKIVTGNKLKKYNNCRFNNF